MNIYVGNLPKTIDEETVRNLFKTYGEVMEVKLIKDQYSGEPRGFGFITMPSKTDAQNAINGLNGNEVDGRKLIVSEARPQKERTGGRHQRGGGGSGGNRGGGFRSRSW